MAFNRQILLWKTSIINVRLAYKSFISRFLTSINYTMLSFNLFFCIQLFPTFFIFQVFQSPDFSEPKYFRVQVFQGPGFFESRFFWVQVFQSPGFSRSRFFRVHFFLSPGFSESRFFRVQVYSGPGFRSSQFISFICIDKCAFSDIIQESNFRQKQPFKDVFQNRFS